MLTALIEFVHRLRDATVPVSMVETLDAARALACLDLSRRDELKAALRATLVKRADHVAAFDALFDVVFAPRRKSPPSRGAIESALTGASTGAPDATAPDGLLEALLDALARNDKAALRALAALAVRQFGGIEADRTASARYYLSRVLRRLDLANVLRRTIQDDRESAGARDSFEARLARDDHGRRIEEFRRLLADAIRDRLVDIKGSQAAADLYRADPVEDADFMTASPAMLRRMRQALQPLARKLTARMAERRRLRRHGRLDVRRTMRRSLSAGGVPLEPAFRHRRISRPDLCLLCDISGSVAEFARFTISLLYALSAEFAKIRSFVFVDGIDEVTDIVASGTTRLDASHLLARTDVVGAEGHSDYGHVFRRFWTTVGPAAVGPKSTVIITGDARTHDRDPGIEAFRAIHERARTVYWLNPEPREEWNTTDSIIGTYAPYCDGVFEVRTLRQLAVFVRGIV